MPKVDVDANFSAQVDKQRDHAKTEAEQAKKLEPVAWNMPEGFEGNPVNEEQVLEAFNRREANEGFSSAVADATSPGTAADIITATTQADYLALMQRAFLARHSYSFPRAYAHQIGRKTGHGSDTGVINQRVAEYVREVIKEGAVEG